MKVAIKRYLEEVLSDYPCTEKYIKERTEALIYPFHEHNDENVGGGHAINRKVEGTAMLAISIATDRRLHQLELNRDAVEFCLNHTDELTQNIIIEVYFKDQACLTLDGVGLKYSASPTTISRHRNVFLEMLGQQLGVI